ncbi:MAG TPA: glycosyltransferase family 39 protein [Candidatus Krumholzibacteria bacterium]|nr:glycosyltransferase family 39 protein [Candidatus Krumholzibacteria bacterium]
MTSATRRIILPGALILCAAAVLRLHHLGWSLPHTYEEATPLRVAFQMWGWDRDLDVSLNPHFFNYPSLVLYVHFIAQGLVFLLLRLAGSIQTMQDWQVLYLTDPSVIYLAERGVNVMFALGSLGGTFLLGRAMAGPVAGLIAALLVAVNPFHIARSQMIEVDMALTCLVSLALWGCVRVAHTGRRHDYVAAGLMIGLAASSKYTGFFLLIPLLVAHLLWNRSRSVAWRDLGLALAGSAAVFALTSPFVLIDFAHFWQGFSTERAHMMGGHFGLSDAPAWRFYLQTLAGRILGLPTATFAAAGIVVWALVRRDRAAIVLLAFLSGYAIIVSSWTMRADRYLLPVLPAVCVFAAGALAALAASPYRRSAARMLACVVLVWLCGTDLVRYRQQARMIQADPRTDAAEWIEQNLPTGSFILVENQGPEFLSPVTIMQLDPGLREAVLEKTAARPLYAVQLLPMSQTSSEQSGPFYSMGLYPDADYVVTTGAVRDRYEHEPARYARQVEFYRQLDLGMQKLKSFEARGGDAVGITVYRCGQHDAPFGARKRATAPPRLPDSALASGRAGASYYFQLGANHEYFGHDHEAYVCYIRALESGTHDEHVFMHCVLGAVRTLLKTRQSDTAVRVLDRAVEIAPDDEIRSMILDLRQRIITHGAL